VFRSRPSKGSRVEKYQEEKNLKEKRRQEPKELLTSGGDTQKDSGGKRQGSHRNWAVRLDRLGEQGYKVGQIKNLAPDAGVAR